MLNSGKEGGGGVVAVVVVVVSVLIVVLLVLVLLVVVSLDRTRSIISEVRTIMGDGSALRLPPPPPPESQLHFAVCAGRVDFPVVEVIAAAAAAAAGTPK